MPSSGRELKPELSSFHALKASPERLEFANSRTRETLTVSLENSSHRTTCFKVCLKAGDANKFRIHPVRGSLNANEKITITVRFKPDGTRAIDEKLQIKYLELETGQTLTTHMFEEEKDSVKILLLPFTFLDLEAEAEDMFKTPKASKWWQK